MGRETLSAQGCVSAARLRPPTFALYTARLTITEGKKVVNHNLIKTTVPLRYPRGFY